MKRGNKILILTPVKDAQSFLEGFFQSLNRLIYDPRLLSLGFLESDSSDDTFSELETRLPALEKRFRRAGLWKRPFSATVPRDL